MSMNPFTSRSGWRRPSGLALAAAIGLLGAAQWGGTHDTPGKALDGKEVFRHDTFGNERFWTDVLRLHEVIPQAVNAKSSGIAPGRLAMASSPSQVLQSQPLCENFCT